MDDYIFTRILDTANMVQELHDFMRLLWMLAIVILILFIVQFIAEVRTATSAVRKKPKALLACTTHIDADTALRTVLEYALQSRYFVEHVDYKNRQIIVSDRPSGFSWGFFYPVYVSTDDSGRTIAEVGAVSRAVQGSFLVSRFHERFFNEVRSAIWLRENRRD